MSYPAQPSNFAQIDRVILVYCMLILRCALLSLLWAGSISAATFGTVVPLTGGAADLALDEARGQLYLVNTNRNEIAVYSIARRTFLTPIATDAGPLSAAMSRDGRFLYVACNTNSALNVINLANLTRTARVTLPAKPEGIAVGNDNRVLISTSGTGAGNTQDVLVIYNPTDGTISNVVIAPAAPQSPVVLPANGGRPALAVRSQLRASVDGSYIVGTNIVSGNNTGGTQSVFVYETASSVVLRSRRVANLSSVLAVAPDNSRFMAGLTLFDLKTLAVLAQENLANASYPISTTANFNLQTNQGGSIFSPSGDTLYSAFNIAPTANPAPRANVSQFLFNDPDNLLIGMALQLPENLAGKMAITADGGTVYALSESGFVQIPLGQLNNSPIATVDSTIQLMASDQCGVTAKQSTATINVVNAGKGRLTASASLIQATTGPANLGGLGGGGIIIIIGGGPGGGTVIGGGGPTNANNTATAPTVRTTLTSSGAQLQFAFNNTLKNSIGTASPFHDYLVQSPEAVNLPPRVRIMQNSRNAEAFGTIVPIAVGNSTAQGLTELSYDAKNQRVYIANAGLNRIEVFDIKKQQLLDPIKVGQLPQSMALTPDGGTMYVANAGGESISIIDVASMKSIGRVVFPATPFDATVTLVTPASIAATERGALFLMSNGSIWSIVGNQAVPRRPSSIVGITNNAQTPLTTPYSLAATPGGEYVIVTSGNGNVYLYDALLDDFVQGRQIQTAPIRGYRNPVTAGPRGQYFVVNGILMNSALTPVADVPSITTPGMGGTFTTTNVPIAAVAQISATQYARFSQPIRAVANANLTTAPTVEIVDINTGAVRSSVSALEGPLSQVANANTATTIGGRTMAVDATGTNAYLLTSSGLSVVSLTPVAAASRPVLNARATVNIGSQTNTVAANTLVAINGRNLASAATAPATGTLPTVLGGVCVTLGANPLPLIMTSDTQINAQLPPTLATGNYQLTVRSLDNHVATAAQVVVVSKYAPAVLLDSNGLVQLYRLSDNKQITQNSPANRDEPLVLYAVGLGVPKGSAITTGNPVPASPAIKTDAVQVYFGNPTIKEAGIIVDGSYFAPGMIGVYMINLRVPGDHIKGNQIVTVKVGGVSSPAAGAVVPKVWIN